MAQLDSVQASVISDVRLRPPPPPRRLHGRVRQFSVRPDVWRRGLSSGVDARRSAVSGVEYYSLHMYESYLCINACRAASRAGAT
jgi:hypothetical protein